MVKTRIAALVVLVWVIFFFILWQFGVSGTAHLHRKTETAKHLFKQQGQAMAEVPRPQTADPDSVRIYIGIVTAWWNFGSRMLLRETYKHFNVTEKDVVDIRFVVGLPPKEDLGLHHFLKWEQDRYEDLQILNISENMNEGKSYEYFASLAGMFPSDNPRDRPYDYAMKADDDTLLNLPQLIERLRPLVPREETYMGRGTEYWHMGAGYTLSWDLVTWLGSNRMEQFMRWDEDQAIGEMLRAGGKTNLKNFVDLGKQVMDEPSNKESDWYREYGPDVILVHRLKNVYLLGQAIEYFLGKGKPRGKNTTM